jgi:cell wall-associated NlpC family hydrolase
MSHQIIKTHGICNLSIIPLRAAASDESEIESQLLFGDYITVIEAGAPWIKVKNYSDGYEGWMDFKQLVYIEQAEFIKGTSIKHPVLTQEVLLLNGPNGDITIMFGSTLPFLGNGKIKLGNETYTTKAEIDTTKRNTVDYFRMYLNKPYLWGGKSIFGIDCSGIVQNCFKAVGIDFPRDASKQVFIGEDIKWSDRQIGDLVYFISSNGKITHVGLLVELDQIIHAHGRVRQDKIDEKGIWNTDLEWYSHLFHSLKRIEI